jgi:hypothetical protein
MEMRRSSAFCKQAYVCLGLIAVRALAAAGLVHGPGGGAIGADGIVVNCPAIAFGGAGRD